MGVDTLILKQTKKMKLEEQPGNNYFDYLDQWDQLIDFQKMQGQINHLELQNYHKYISGRSGGGPVLQNVFKYSFYILFICVCVTIVADYTA